MELNLEVTGVFERNYDAYLDPKIINIVNQGGTSSSKSYSILQLLIFIAINNPKITITASRESLPLLKRTLIKDFVKIMNSLGIYEEKNHNKTEQTYKFKNRSIIQFVSTDEVSKLRGVRSDVLFIDEANAINYEAYEQLSMRTKGKVFIGFNPSEADNYIFDKVLADTETSILIHSTYRDNEFLDDIQIKKIDDLINKDPEFARVYRDGLAPRFTTRIYNHFKTITKVPVDAKLISMGIDFGFNHPTALIALYEFDDNYYFDEIIYQSYLTTTELVQLMNTLNVDKSTKIFADYSRPEIITEIRKAGYKIENANKEVKKGIDSLKSNSIYITSRSVNTLDEYKKYMWKTLKDKITDEPLKMNDDAMDAMRYALHTHIVKSRSGELKLITFNRR